MSSGASRDVIVIGGGVAGLSAAVALAGDGADVTLLERRPYIGGRATRIIIRRWMRRSTRNMSCSAAVPTS